MANLSGNDQQLLVFTDLDGTLLDHDSYSFAPAQQALALIAERGIPLVINSSKTSAEIVAVQQALNICQPFISENGAAVFMPLIEGASAAQQQWQRQPFAVSRDQVLTILHELRAEHGYHFSGFADGDAAAISELTGLSLEEATLAGQRDYSEPLQWRDSDAELIKFLKQLAAHNLTAQQGGRFLTVMSQSVDKARAMQWLTQHIGGQANIRTIALGDSPNDERMLNAADIAVVIKSARSEALLVSGPQRIIRTELPGPAGWQWAMDRILSANNAAQ
jgi:mannosyl-3-phosphoglycerate phosphatase